MKCLPEFEHQEQFRKRGREALRQRLSSGKRGYDEKHRMLRAQMLAEEPYCVMCAKEGRRVFATEADHIIPLSKGGRNERENYQPLCKPHNVQKGDSLVG